MEYRKLICTEAMKSLEHHHGRENINAETI